MGINFKPHFKLKAAGGDSALNKRGVNQTNLYDVYLSVLPGHTLLHSRTYYFPLYSRFSSAYAITFSRSHSPYSVANDVTL